MDAPTRSSVAIAIPVLLVMLLALTLVIARVPRSSSGGGLGWLFREHSLSAWWRALVASHERARESYAARLAARARSRGAVTPPLGPPRLGFVGRVTTGIAALLAICFLVFLFVALGAGLGWAVFGAVYVAPAAFGLALLISAICAALISVLPVWHVAIAAACGAVGAALTLWIVPAVAKGPVPALLSVAGAMAGLVVGVADERSRQSGGADDSLAPTNGTATS